MAEHFDIWISNQEESFSEEYGSNSLNKLWSYLSNGSLTNSNDKEGSENRKQVECIRKR